MNVLLVFATYYDIANYRFEKKRVFWEPLGVAYLAGYLRREGYSVDILYPLVEGYTREDVNNYFNQNIHKYDLVGLSAPSFSVDLIKDYVSIIKSTGYKNPIICGGLGPTCAWEKFLDSGVDGIVVGEGEKAILEIARKIEKGLDYKDVKGLAYKDSNGKKIRNGYVELLENLDDNSFPARDIIVKLSKNVDVEHIHIQIQSSRGCYGNCSFCSMANLLKTQGGKIYRSRSAKNVVEEMYMLNNLYGFKCFDFMDENFFSSNKEYAISKAEEFVAEIKSRNLNIELFIQCQMHVISKRLLELLREINVKCIYVGLDSFNQKDLKLYNKPYNVEMVNEFLEIVKSSDYKFDVDAPFRIKTGYINFSPLSTLEELKDCGEKFKKYGLTCKKLINHLRVDDYNGLLASKIRKEFPDFSENNYFKDKDVEILFNELTRFFNETISIRNEVRNLELILDKEVPNQHDRGECKNVRKWIDEQIYECYFGLIDLIKNGNKHAAHSFVDEKLKLFTDKFNIINNFLTKSIEKYVDYDYQQIENMHVR